MKSWKEGVFPSLVAFCALAVSGSAAFFSVTGLSKLFAGASFQVIIMAASLELSKLVIASLLYRYWNELSRLLKYYLTVAAIILVIITSMGIYGFLSSAYQETASIYQITNTELTFLEEKQKLYEEDVLRYNIELDRISQSISELSKAKAREIQVVDSNAIGGIRNTISTSELRLAESRIRAEERNRVDLVERRDVSLDSLKSIQTRLLELKVANSTIAELGPLIYLSNLSGIEMDRIVNLLLLAIVFVFDPLALSLVIAANFVYLKVSRKEELDLFKISSDENSITDKLFELPKKIKNINTINRKEEIKMPKTKKNTQEADLSKKVSEVSASEESSTTKTARKQKIQETLVSPIVKILQKTPSFIHVLRSNGKRDKLTKEEYKKETNS